MSDDSLADARTDGAVLADLGAALERVRLERNLTQRDLAARAGLSKRTLERIEAGESTTTVNLVRVLRALDQLQLLDAVAPTASPEPSPWQELRHARRERRRASPRASRTAPQAPAADAFRWGDEPADGPA